MRGALLCVPLCALLCAAPGAANAQPAGTPQSASDKALAETLFREGRALIAEGKIDDACAKLEGSHRIDPKTGTLTNLAACHEAQGKTASAWAEFSEAAAQAANAHRSNVEQVARARAAALESRLSRLTIRLAAPDPNVDVSIDGRHIDTAALGTPIPLDPGAHTVTARLGEAVWSSEARIGIGPSSAELEIPRLAAPAPKPALASALPPAASPAHAGSAADPGATSPSPSPSRGRTIATYGAFGLGAIGLGAGTFFGVRTLGQKSDADALCRGSVCSSQTGKDLAEEARSSATLSTIAFGVGLVAVAAGIYLLVTAPASSTTKATIAFDRSGLAGRF